MATVGVLCARIRVEERALLDALMEAGVTAAILPPAASPLDLATFPSPPTPSAQSDGETPALIVDRCQERASGAAVTAIYRSGGTTIVDAGLASSHNRLDVAVAMAQAGLPRPVTRLAPSGDAGLVAVEAIGFPATVLPLRSGAHGSLLLDRDVAEALFEHRDTLGDAATGVTLVQAGMPTAANLLSVLVVGSQAIAVAARSDLTALDPAALRLAERAAAAVGSSLCAVDLLRDGTDLLIWDLTPVPEMRNYSAIGDTTVYAALAALIAQRLGGDPVQTAASMAARSITAAYRVEAIDGVVLSA